MPMRMTALESRPLALWMEVWRIVPGVSACSVHSRKKRCGVNAASASGLRGDLEGVPEEAAGGGEERLGGEGVECGFEGHGGVNAEKLKC
jgi:hypothetical protein